MFICNECLGKNYKNRESFLSKSHGPCECCREPKLCSDIPSKYLVVRDCQTDTTSELEV